MYVIEIVDHALSISPYAPDISGRISRSIREFPLSEINNVADMLRNGETNGRAVIVPEWIYPDKKFSTATKRSCKVRYFTSTLVASLSLSVGFLFGRSTLRIPFATFAVTLDGIISSGNGTLR